MIISWPANKWRYCLQCKGVTCFTYCDNCGRYFCLDHCRRDEDGPYHKACLEPKP
jgi:hypothetical protein